MDLRDVREKFGGDFIATERTFRMGIDRRFGECVGERFKFPKVLETCTGGGFSTIALARAADHVVSVDSVLYEMPRGYAGRRVTLQRRLLEGTYAVSVSVFPRHPLSLGRRPRPLRRRRCAGRSWRC